jgi:hypothetical protein
VVLATWSPVLSVANGTWLSAISSVGSEKSGEVTMTSPLRKVQAGFDAQTAAMKAHLETTR